MISSNRRLCWEFSPYFAATFVRPPLSSPMAFTRICASYADGAPGETFGVWGSMGFLEIAANRASAAQLLGAGKGAEVNVVMEPK